MPNRTLAMNQRGRLKPLQQQLRSSLVIGQDDAPCIQTFSSPFLAISTSLPVKFYHVRIDTMINDLLAILRLLSIVFTAEFEITICRRKGVRNTTNL
jgi:hypothetical protein